MDSTAATVRQGSPFDGPSFPTPLQSSPAALPFNYVALAASNAAWVLVFQAFIGAWFFPLGGLLAAGLGVAMAFVGLGCNRHWVAAMSLVIHPIIAGWIYSNDWLG